MAARVSLPRGARTTRRGRTYAPPRRLTQSARAQLPTSGSRSQEREHDNVSAELPATVSKNFGRGTKAVVKVLQK